MGKFTITKLKTTQTFRSLWAVLVRKRALTLVVLGIVGVILGFLLVGRDPKTVPTVKLLIWTDYIDKGLIRDFEKEFKCTVEITTYTSNDELLQILSERPNAADVVVPSSYAFASLIRNGFLAKLDSSKLPNRKFIDDSFMAKSGWGEFKEYGIPYLVAPTGVGIPVNLNSRTSAPSISWRDLDQLDENGISISDGATMLSDKRETFGAALLACGLKADSSSRSDLEQAAKLLKQWCENGLRINGKTYHYHMLTGRKQFCHCYLGDVLPLQEAIEFCLPREGFVLTCDCMAVTSNCSNHELALRFINYFCDPSTSALNMKWTLYRSPNEEAFSKLKDAIPPEVFSKLAFDLHAGTVLPSLSEADEELLNGLWKPLEQYHEDND